MQFGKFEKLRDSYAVAREEGDFIYGLVRALMPDVCVETGTHKGLSACYIGSALKANDKGHLWTYDVKDFGVERSFAEMDVADCVSFVCGSSLDIRQKDIDFVFVDAEHYYEFVVEELRNLLPKLKDGAIVAIHNTCPQDNETQNYGINKAIEELKMNVVYLPTLFGITIYQHKK